MQPKSPAEAERLAQFGLSKKQLIADIGAFADAWHGDARAASHLGISDSAFYNSRVGHAPVALAIFQQFYVLGATGSSSWAARGPDGHLIARPDAGAPTAPAAEPDTSAADARAFAAATGCGVDRSDRLPAPVKAEGGTTIGLGTAAELMEAGGLTAETVHADLMALRRHFQTWGNFAEACGVHETALGNQARGNVKLTMRVVEAFYTEDDDGQLVLTERWQALRDTAPDDGEVEEAAPLNGTKVPVVEVAHAAYVVAAVEASAALAAAIDNAVAAGEISAVAVPLEREAAEAARFDPNIEDDGFVTVRPVLSPPAGSAVVEGAGADAAALVGSAVDAGAAAATTGDPADGAGEAPPVASPAQPVDPLKLAAALKVLGQHAPEKPTPVGENLWQMRFIRQNPVTLTDEQVIALAAERSAPWVQPDAKLAAHTVTETLFANPSPHARQAGPNVVQHVVGGEAVHWRWTMRASMSMRLTSLLAKQAEAQDVLDELNEQIAALRVLRAIGDELPEPDPVFVAAMVRGSTEAQVAA